MAASSLSLRAVSTSLAARARLASVALRIAHLSKIRALKVISRSSVMPFKQRTQSAKEIGARLEATTLLDGSVRRVGDRVRIVAQLIDAEPDDRSRRIVLMMPSGQSWDR